MRIEKEQLNNLKQLDRIEYRYKHDRISDINTKNNIEPTKYLIVLSFLFIFDLWFKLRFDQWVFTESSWGFLMGGIILCVILDMIGCILVNYLCNKRLSELDKEYFKIEPIKK